MPRKKQASLDLSPDPDYWTKFLKSQGLIGDFLVDEAVPVAEESALARDPDFLQFLQVASQYGAPKNMEAFNKLDAKQKGYYLRAYKIYLEAGKKI